MEEFAWLGQTETDAIENACISLFVGSQGQSSTQPNRSDAPEPKPTDQRRSADPATDRGVLRLLLAAILAFVLFWMSAGFLLGWLVAHH